MVTTVLEFQVFNYCPITRMSSHDNHSNGRLDEPGTSLGVQLGVDPVQQTGIVKKFEGICLYLPQGDCLENPVCQEEN